MTKFKEWHVVAIVIDGQVMADNYQARRAVSVSAVIDRDVVSNHSNSSCFSSGGVHMKAGLSFLRPPQLLRLGAVTWPSQNQSI